LTAGGEARVVELATKMILLFCMTGLLVLGFFGTICKALFDDWQVRQASRRQ
jgi:hypothetical protein